MILAGSVNDVLTMLSEKTCTDKWYLFVLYNVVSLPLTYDIIGGPIL